MVEIADIKDGDSLEAWLEDKSQDWAVWIAARAAARVLPHWWDWTLSSERARDRDLTALPVLRSLLISSVAAKMPTEDIRAAAATAAAYASDAAATAAYASDDAATAAAYASDAAAADAAAYAAAASDAAYASAYASDDAAAAAAWDNIRADCRGLEAEESCHAAALWAEGDGPLKILWDGIKRRVWVDGTDRSEESARGPVEAPWNFWVRWYDGLLAGKEPNWDLLYAIATGITDDEWNAGPDAVARRIEEISEEQLRRSTFNAERIVENPETGRLRVEPVSTLSMGELEDVQDKMRGASEAFDGEGGENGPYAALAPEVGMVRHAAERNAPRPIYLYDTCRRAMRRAMRKAEQGDCPDDALVADFIGQLDEASADLRLFNADVARVVAARAESKLGEAGAEAHDVFVAAAAEVAGHSEGDLAEELPQDAQTATDPEADREERQTALYRFAGRMTRIHQAAKPLAGTLKEETDDYAALSKNLAVVLGWSWGIARAIRVLIGLF